MGRTIKYGEIYDSDNFGPIYWRDFRITATNPANRDINLSIDDGSLRATSLSPETTGLSISSGSTIWARRNPRVRSAVLSASINAKTVISASSYTFYNGASTSEDI